MERYKKVLFCPMLNKEVTATYFFENLKSHDGSTKLKTIDFYNCNSRKACSDAYDVMDCECFKEILKVEHEINIT